MKIGPNSTRGMQSALLYRQMHQITKSIQNFWWVAKLYETTSIKNSFRLFTMKCIAQRDVAEVNGITTCNFNLELRFSENLFLTAALSEYLRIHEADVSMLVKVLFQ